MHAPATRANPLFYQSVEKALAILEVFGGDRRAMNLAEIATTAAGMTKSSAQRCTHSALTSRWTLDELRAKLSSILLETTRAAPGGTAPRMSG